MALAAIPPLAMSLFLMTSQRQAHTTLQQLAATHPDVPENLPPGSHPRTSPSQWALELAKSNSGSSFYFPSLACGEPPDPATKLVPNCDGRIKSTRSEGVGLLISLLIAVLLIARATRDYRMADRT